MGDQKDTEYNATPFSHGAEIVTVATRHNIGNIWEILGIFGKYWKYLAAAEAAAAQKESNELVSSA